MANRKRRFAARPRMDDSDRWWGVSQSETPDETSDDSTKRRQRAGCVDPRLSRY